MRTARTPASATANSPNRTAALVSRPRNIFPAGSRRGIPTCSDQMAVTTAKATTIAHTPTSQRRSVRSASDSGRAWVAGRRRAVVVVHGDRAVAQLGFL